MFLTVRDRGPAADQPPDGRYLLALWISGLLALALLGDGAYATASTPLVL